MKGISAKKTEEYKKVLLDRRQQLMQSVRNQREEMPDRGLKGTTGDTSDHAAADYAAEVFGFLLEKQAGNLEEVEIALQKLDGGDYGTCEDCSKRITDKRLDALPWACLCHGCQEKQDRNSARGRRRPSSTANWSD